MKVTRTLVVALMIATLAIFGCSQGGDKPAAKKEAPAAKAEKIAAPTGEPIKIGAILAVTGKASFLGGPEARTIEMLAEQVNAAGGINGRPIELIIKDTGANSEKAVSFAKQLVEEDKVIAIIGPSTSGETMAIKNYMEESKAILISCGAAEVIVNPVAKYVFKTPQKDSFAIKKIFTQMQSMGIKKIGLAYGGTGFGKAGRKQIEAIAPEFGIEVAIAEVYSPSETDLTAIVNKIKGKGVDAVINWSIVPAQAIIIKNMRQLGFDVPLFQSHGFGNIKYVEAAGVAANGVIFPAGRLLVVDTLADDNPQKAVLSKYKADYESKYNETASTFGGHAYDAFMILVKAIEQAGTDTEAVRSAIEGMQGFVGTGGVFNFSAEDHNGLDIEAFEMLTVKDGKFTLLK
jgi:branched-chain amino acid transport system substrate-binding protein